MPIEARGLTKRFGDFVAASDMHFAIPRGQIFGLLGPNGAGKSTTFKMLCGLLTPTSGSGAVAGFDLRRRVPTRARLGYMAQKFSLYGDLSVARTWISSPASMGSTRGRQARDRGDDRDFELKGEARFNAGTLPLGFKQRLALACAVMHEPRRCSSTSRPPASTP